MSIPSVYIVGLRQGRRQAREEIAAATGMSVERQRIIEESYAIPSYQERRAYACHFGFASVEEFDEGWRSRRVVLSRGELGGRIPVINLAPAGPPGDYHEPYCDSGIGQAYIDPPPGIVGPNLFAFVIIGDSMEPDYPQGHYAICRPTAAEEIADGQAVFVRFGAARDQTCTFKQSHRVDAQYIELRAINLKYPSQKIRKVDIDRMSPVIAVLSPESGNQGTKSDQRRLIREDVQLAPDEI